MSMRGNTQHAQRSSKTRLLRAGYSFPEVMFAVVVLGIGFIMLAAVFPVAVRQTKLTSDENRAMAIARGVSGMMGKIAEGSDAPDYEFYAWAFDEDRRESDTQNNVTTFAKWNNPRVAPDVLPLHVGNSIFPATGENKPWFTEPQKNGGLTWYPPRPRPSPAIYPGNVVPIFTRKGWDAIRGNTITDNDPRFGWVVLYRRDGDPNLPPSTWADNMQLFVIVTVARNRPIFAIGPDSTDQMQAWVDATQTKDVPLPHSLANLYPRFVQVKVINDYKAKQPSDGPGVDVLQVNAPVYGQSEALVEGSYVIMRDQTNAKNTTRGRVYQIGSKVSGNEWELLPGNDLVDSRETSNGWEIGYVVGAERTLDRSGKQIFSGPSQDIYFYTSIVPIGH